MLKDLLQIFFKSKNVELTTDDLLMLEKLEQQTGVPVAPKANVEIPAEISHNIKIINDLKNSFESQLNELKQEKEGYKAEIDKLTQIIGEERQLREQSAAVLKERHEKEKSEKVEQLVKQAIESKKLAGQDTATIEKIKALGMTDFDTAKTLIDAMNPIIEQNQSVTTKTIDAAKPTTIDYKIAGAASPQWLKYTEEQFAKVDSYKEQETPTVVFGAK